MKPLAVRPIRTGYVLELWVGENTAPMSILDFHAAGFSKVLAEATARSFVALQGGNAVESQNANWRLVRSFGNFLSKEYGYIKKFPADCLKRFGKYLEATGKSLTTTGAAYNAAPVVVSDLTGCLEIFRRSSTGIFGSREARQHRLRNLALRQGRILLMPKYWRKFLLVAMRTLKPVKLRELNFAYCL